MCACDARTLAARPLLLATGNNGGLSLSRSRGPGSAVVGQVIAGASAVVVPSGVLFAQHRLVFDTGAAGLRRRWRRR